MKKIKLSKISGKLSKDDINLIKKRSTHLSVHINETVSEYSKECVETYVNFNTLKNTLYKL